MQKFADHSMQHGYTPEQWATAYHRIQVAKDTGKPCDCAKFGCDKSRRA